VVFAEGYDFGYMSGAEFTIGLTGEDEISVNNSVQIYPNPFTETAYVSFSTSQTETVSVNVYNSIGKLVYTLNDKDYSAGTHTIAIDGNELNNGMYFVNLKIGENTYKQKLVLTK
jgi:flagellar hook assembly protein FlgD